MVLYRALFVNHAGDVFSVADFEAEHDDAAILYAKRFYVCGIGKGFEIWQGDRLIHACTNS